MLYLESKKKITEFYRVFSFLFFVVGIRLLSYIDKYTKNVDGKTGKLKAAFSAFSAFSSFFFLKSV